MKLKTTLIISLFFSIGLFAQERQKGEAYKVKDHPLKIQKKSAAIDTLTPYPQGCDSTLLLTRASGGGFVIGTNSYGDLEKAQFFPSATAGSVTEILVFIGSLEIVGSADAVSAKIYGGNVSSGPTNLLGTSDPVVLSNVDTTSLTSFSFSNPVNFSSPFFASVEVSTGDDTLGIVHTDTSCLANAWEMWSDNSWNNIDDAWGDFDVSLLMYAVVDDQSVGTNENLISGKALDIYPNPAEQEISLRFEKDLSEDAEVHIKSTDGKLIQGRELNLPAGKSEYKLAVAKLYPGVYLLEVKSDNQFYREIFIKK